MKHIEPAEGGRLVGYARVSTADQRLDLQLDALRKAGVHDDNLHQENISAAARHRPGLDMAFRDLRAGDVLVVWKLDRLARSIPDLVRRLEALEEIGAGFRSLTEAIDTTTAMGRLVLHIMGAVAQFERDLARERTKAGMQAAARKGMKLGASKKLSAEQIAALERDLANPEMTVREAAMRAGIHINSVYNYVGGGKRTAMMKRT